MRHKHAVLKEPILFRDDYNEQKRNCHMFSKDAVTKYCICWVWEAGVSGYARSLFAYVQHSQNITSSKYPRTT